MAVYHGKTAKVNFGGVMSFTTGWSISTTGDIAESTDMNDTFQLFEPGFDDATFTVEGHACTERDTIGQLSTTAAELRCYIDANNYFYADVFCTSITEVSSMNDVGKLTYNFEMSDVNGLQYG